jgi:predicted nuclease of predicted toxin-antitoxin system
MALTIYLDECSDHDSLIAFLTQAGHTVISPRAAGAKGWKDPNHLAYAAAHGYVLLTKNPRDFDMLHKSWHTQGRTHSGIFVIYGDNNARKDMTYADIVYAIANLVASGLPIVNEIYILNQWQ